MIQGWLFYKYRIERKTDSVVLWSEMSAISSHVFEYLVPSCGTVCKSCRTFSQVIGLFEGSLSLGCHLWFYREAIVPVFPFHFPCAGEMQSAGLHALVAMSSLGMTNWLPSGIAGQSKSRSKLSLQPCFVCLFVCDLFYFCVFCFAFKIRLF